MPKVLLIEDDANIAQNIADKLRAEKYFVDVVASGADGLERLLSGGYDLAVVDWMLPEMSGVSLCEQFRNGGGHTPILMLTGNTTIEHKQKGFQSGADDYLTKPCDPRELIMRVQALLRRPGGYVQDTISYSNIVLDIGSRTVTCDGQPLDLQPLEFALLEFLIKKPEYPFPPEVLQNRLWPTDSASSPEVVYTCITKLRKKLAAAKAQCEVKSVYRVGYKLALLEPSQT
jgi:DNA-binding response OmpR family regulator